MTDSNSKFQSPIFLCYFPRGPVRLSGSCSLLHPGGHLFCLLPSLRSLGDSFSSGPLYAPHGPGSCDLLTRVTPPSSAPPPCSQTADPLSCLSVSACSALQLIFTLSFPWELIGAHLHSVPICGSLFLPPRTQILLQQHDLNTNQRPKLANL